MIRKIFFADCRNLFRSIFAVIIAIGVCVIPALYAWLNIFSNHDPYANTGKIRMAVVSLDEGCEQDGEMQNVGDSVIEKLHDNTSLDWQFMDSKDEAVSSVKSGDNYAALIIPQNFTASMYNVFSDKLKRPKLILYQNQKKNAVANKITDTVTTTLQSSINETFVSTMSTKIFNGMSGLKDKLSEGATDAIVDRLKKLREDIESFKSILKKLHEGSGTLREALDDASGEVSDLADASRQMSEDIGSSKEDLDKADEEIKSFGSLAKKTITGIQTALSNLKLRLETAKASKDIEGILQSTENALEDITSIKRSNNALKDAIRLDITGVDTSKITSACEKFSIVLNTIEGTLRVFKKLDGVGDKAESVRTDVVKKLETAISGIDKLETMVNTSIVPAVQLSVDSIRSILDNSVISAENLGNTLDSSITIFDSLQLTLNQADSSFDSTDELLTLFENRLDALLEKVKNASESEVEQIIMDTLSGDVDNYAEFFSEPVKINTNSIYPSSNYGSSVAPFYTVLALWVGAIVLAAIVKVHPPAKKFPGARDYQLFFGRMLTYIVLGQIQSLIIVWGDLYLLKIDCAEVGLFVFGSAYTSLVFSMFIFSLVYTFGDVGKAITVVAVVVQIAGSSGTYPIELLPEFFQKIYIFFPFPYAINALRECVGGRYGNDFYMYLLKLSAFIVVALVIGLLIRKPFKNINHYVEKRMEDTEMM